ncbi:hypothetical protein AAWM_06684 [Aspergillus awamori]|uniref:Zn(2)-C6 fungal-type domain-containing protein n=1 Tax=Aspergillus awamori TaxID=105351 RepID=A0A401KX12_ASPAW|nr:hypothetical protein AAWM_06684 [Aspergillus awamori]
MPQPMRQTQRVPRTCIQCARRKIKCSKKIPCEECIRRGDTVACKREIVRVHGKVTVAVDEEKRMDDSDSESNLVRENISLKTRIRQLESVLSRPETLKLEADIFRLSPAAENPQSSDRVLNDFQSLPFGLLVEASQVSGGAIHPRDDHLLLVLPDRHWSETIVRFSLTHFGWVHCALDTSAFVTDHSSFWDHLSHSRSESLKNHAWIAVYLSVLAIGVYFMADDHICKIRFLQESLPSYRSSLLSRVPMELCRIWCEAALKELGYANYLSKPSISTVQTLVILNIVHKNLGESCREYTLHGLAVNIARLIGIDRLGGRSDRPSNCLLKDTGLIRKNENVYRRLWWTLVICDWMTVWSRPISIHPDSFTTVLETEDGEEVPPIIAGEDKHIPSPFEYHKAMAQLAATMQNHARSINEWTTVAVRASFEELDSVAATFPPHLSYPGTDESVLAVEQGLEWIHVQRSLIFNCLDCWHINLCVALIPQLLGNPATGEDDVQQSGISCAKAILSRRYHDPCPHFHKFWATTCSTVTAAIFLALDLICFRHHRSSAEVAEEKALILFGIYLVERTCTDTRHDALLVLRRLVELSNVLRPRQFIDQKVFVRLMKLVASPKLWASFSDTEVTLRFLFADLSSTGEASKSALDHDEQIQSTDAGDVTCGNILPNTLSRFATVSGEAGDLLPLEDDLFSSELFDMSLPWLDPGSLMAFSNEASF